MKQILQYLKRHRVTDTQTINRLFVSTFVAANSLKVINNDYIQGYLIADGDDYASYLYWIQKKVKEKNLKFGLEELISLFEFVISPSDRVITGAVYTPKPIRDKIVSRCLEGIQPRMLADSKVADISCGCGGFLMDVSLCIYQRTGRTFTDIYRNNIFGIDIEEYSIERTKIVLTLLALMHGEDEKFEFNLLCADTLDCRSVNFDKRFKSFDIIVGNPPYVCSRNMSDDTKGKAMAFEVCRYGHPDLYIPFIQIAIDSLNAGGRMGFITMNSFFNSLNGRGLREYLSERQMEVRIVDFRGFQVFSSRSTYTCLLFVSNSSSAHLSYASLEEGLAKADFYFEQIPYESLDAARGWNLRWTASAAKYEKAGIPLGKYCSSRHGIATLSNKTYIFRPESVDDNVYVLEKNGAKFPIERAICRDVVNSNKLNSAVDFDTLIEKVIYPYYLDDMGRAVVYNEEEMRVRFPMALAYLQSQREVLEERDKRHTYTYPVWYAYGRTQSLVMPRYKLFFPKIANKPLQCVLKDASQLMLYNGMAFVSDDLRQLQVLKCFIESDVFWRYVSSNAKPYASGFYSLNGVNIKKFGIPNMSRQQISVLLAIEDSTNRNAYINQLYSKVR